MKEGIIGRRTCEMDLRKLESVNVRQSILGRILKYGRVELIGTGGTKGRFKMIPRPLIFRKRIMEEKMALVN